MVGWCIAGAVSEKPKTVNLVVGISGVFVQQTDCEMMGKIVSVKMLFLWPLLSALSLQGRQGGGVLGHRHLSSAEHALCGIGHDGSCQDVMGA